jgi:hypothetical protein
MQWVEQGFMKWFDQGFMKWFDQGFMKCSLQEYILNILHTKYIFRFSDFLFNGFYWRFFKGICRETF